MNNTVIAKPKRGPKPKEGPRYPCGKLRPEGISPSGWQRIKTDVVRIANDTRLGTEVGRLSFHGELTAAQTAAAFRVGEIYGRFERFKRLRRSAASPSYMAGYGDPDLDEDRMTKEELATLEDRIQTAKREYALVQNELPVYPPRAAALLERLCVDDQPVTEHQLVYVCAMLDRLVTAFGENWRKRKGGPADMRRLGNLRPAERRATRSTETPVPRRDNASRMAWTMVMRKLRPDLDDTALARVYELQRVLADREQFRQSKVGA